MIITKLDPSQDNKAKPLLWWLGAMVLLILLMMLVGAITRLTESGLSMVEWRPLLGWIPPLSDQEWQRLFGLYQQTSQYRLMNNFFTLTEFQTIFWWEYWHRFLGRLLGLVVALPLIYFWIKGCLSKRQKFHMLGLLLLGGVQGAIGWWMVVSGFEERTEVSPFRLAIHLGMALLILAYVAWLLFSWSERPLKPLATHNGIVTQWIHRGWILSLLIFITMMMGAITAGSRAGYIYNDWPKFGGVWWPEFIFQDAAQHGYFLSLAFIQFIHRLLAYISFFAIMLNALYTHHLMTPPTEPFAHKTKLWSNYLAGLVILQIGLGVATLLTVVNLPLAVLHQLNGAILLLASLRLNWWLGLKGAYHG